jgi:hypothetical protein
MEVAVSQSTASTADGGSLAGVVAADGAAGTVWSSTIRFGERLEGLVADADTDVQLREDGSAEIRSSRGCDSVFQQLLAGDSAFLGAFEPVTVDFGELGSATLPGGFTMVMDSRLIYVTLQEPVEYDGCDAIAIPGLAVEQSLPREISGTTSARVWSVTWSCTEVTPGVRSVKSYLLAEDGSGMSVGLTLGTEGSPDEVSELSAFGGDGPEGFLATYVQATRSSLERGAQGGESDDVIPVEVPQGGRLVPIALPSSGRAELATTVPPSGTVIAGNLRIPFACAE